MAAFSDMSADRAPSPAGSSESLSESFLPSLRALVLAGATILPLTGLAGCAEVPEHEAEKPAATSSYEHQAQAEHQENQTQAERQDNSGGITILHNGKLGIDLGGGIGMGLDGSVGISLF